MHYEELMKQQNIYENIVSSKYMTELTTKLNNNNKAKKPRKKQQHQKQRKILKRNILRQRNYK